MIFKETNKQENVNKKLTSKTCKASVIISTADFGASLASTATLSPRFLTSSLCGNKETNTN